MTDQARAARDDLAFLKAVVEDRGPLPALMGAHLLAPGLIYGANFVLVWAIYARQIPWPPAWANLTWAPGAILYLPIAVVLALRGRGALIGPAARAFGAAGAALGLMIWSTIAVVATAQAVTRDASLWALWPPLLFVLYGGAWAVVCVMRRKGWYVMVALGSFATAVAATALMKTPQTWLVLAAGMVLFVAAPGAAILSRARRQA